MERKTLLKHLAGTISVLAGCTGDTVESNRSPVTETSATTTCGRVITAETGAIQWSELDGGESDPDRQADDGPVIESDYDLARGAELASDGGTAAAVQGARTPRCDLDIEADDATFVCEFKALTDGGNPVLEQFEDTYSFVHYVTQETRTSIIQTILGHPAQSPSGTEIKYMTPKSPGTVGPQLNEMVQKGLIEKTALDDQPRDAPNTFYTISAEGWDAFEKAGIFVDEVDEIGKEYDSVEKSRKVREHENATRPAEVTQKLATQKPA